MTSAESPLGEIILARRKLSDIGDQFEEGTSNSCS